MVRADNVDMVLCSIVGTGGLIPVMEALRAGREIALASKEVLVMAGSVVMPMVKRYHTRLIPVDSEHSAIYQCLGSRAPANVERLILTASGGPFRKASPGGDEERDMGTRPGASDVVDGAESHN